MNIDVSEKTFERLSNLAKGFDTPDAVINRLIDEVTKKPEVKPVIFFNPENEGDFKTSLLETKLAEVCLFSANMKPSYSLWNADKFKDTSNLKANLWSGFLRGWKDKGITKIELTVLDSNVDKRILEIGHALGLSYHDTLIIQPHIHREDENTYLISFGNEDYSIIDKIQHKVDNDINVYLPSFMLDL